MSEYGDSGVTREATALGVGQTASSTAHRSGPAGRRREDRIVGASQASRDLVESATAASRTDLPVVLVGPPGSDKELVARAIHSWGPRRDRPFEAVACGAIPEALQGRELFGCEAQVYPAAPSEFAGAIERCEGGTLLLDLDGLGAKQRSALVEAMRSGSYRREGGAGARSLETRIVCAQGVAGDRSDFTAFPHHEIGLVPLSERPEDILPLAAHYLAAFAEDAGIQPVGYTAEARACLVSEPWSGDVQELRQRVKQAIRLSGQGALSAESLLLARDSDEVPSFKEAKRAFETRYVESLLRRCSGNISRAARMAKKDRKDFYDVIRRTGVNPQEFR
jgi:two-component system response regulator GlrR